MAPRQEGVATLAKTIRLRPGKPLAFPSDAAFTFAGIRNPGTCYI